MKVEIEAYKALVDDHGRPCYPIELGFDVLDDSGQYQDIISYWQKEEGMTRFARRWVFFVQLERFNAGGNSVNIS